MEIQSDTRTFVISNVKGLHARAASKFVRCASQFNAEITVSRDGHDVDGTSIMGLLMLAAAKGSSIEISAQGPEAIDALNALGALIDAKFDEE